MVVILSVYFLPIIPPLPDINIARPAVFIIYVLMMSGMARKRGQQIYTTVIPSRIDPLKKNLGYVIVAEEIVAQMS